MITITKADLVANISAVTRVNAKDVVAVVNKFMNQVKEEVSCHRTVALRGFGSFVPVKKAEHKARDIKRGETVIIPAHDSVKFKPSEDFKKSLR